MDEQRNPKTSYCVELLDDEELIAVVSTYSTSGLKDKIRMEYRLDALPTWVRTGIDLLDLATVDGHADIPKFGHKTDRSYWFFSDQVYAVHFNGKQ